MVVHHGLTLCSISFVALFVAEIIRCLDVVAPRRYATVRHAGELTERRGLVDELHLNRLPLVPLVLGRSDGNGHSGPAHTDRSRGE